MNEYRIDDLKIGMKESFEVTVTEEMMTAFCSVTGDVNPLHTDREYAKAAGYDDRVCYGMLTASFLSTLAGVYLPGRYSLIRTVEIKCALPVFVGDRLTVTGTVTEISTDYGFFEMKVEIRNTSGEKVLRGNMQVGFVQHGE